ncbi:MAG: homoserine kinase [Actinomycetia bacterium]|nr:homoserine kinase [Actinomycetes bacterium]MDX6332783.1 homoserine kinase [Streptosporangiaceae bacterium]
MSGSRWRDKPVVVRAPASSANLGPGFDALGLALSLHDVAVARVTGGGLDIEVSGEGGATAAAGEAHLVVRAMRAAFDVLGGQPPGLSLRSLNAIPHGRGLGSSAAAIVTGILAARGLAQDGAALLPDDAVLALAARLEGHPDNVAACLHGGLTISWTALPAGPGYGPDPARPGDGSAPAPPGPRVVRLPVLEEIRPVVLVAEESLATQTARGALPAAVPHRDAAANAARSALLVAALIRVPEVLFDATQDFLHQPYRAAVMPKTADLLARLRAAGVAAVVSGAGPSVLAFTVAGQPGGPDLVDSIAAETGIGWRISPLAIDRQGATLQTAVPGERPRNSAR